MSDWTSFLGELGTASLVLQIILVNIVLSGDNAVVIALACRGLPHNQRRMGMFLGAAVAVVLRIVFTLVVVQLLAIPLLRVAGGLLLFWIAIKLIIEDDENESEIASSDRLWKAVKTVAIADAVMSLDNVLAIAGIAQGSTGLLILGLAISIPLIVLGASLLTLVLDRFPILVWAGAALLGWVAGEMIVGDPIVLKALAGYPGWVLPDPSAGGELKPASLPHYLASALGAAVVIAAALFVKRRRKATV